MHFRTLYAIIVRQFIAETLNKPVREITPEHFIWYVTWLRNAPQRGGLLDTTKCVFQILFQTTPKSQEVRDYVGCWLKQTTPLINILYPGKTKVICKPTKAIGQNEIGPYNIKFCNWKSRTNGPSFDPEPETINAIYAVLNEYNNPSHPIEKGPEKYVRKRRSVDDCRMLSPPRRVRKRVEITQPTACYTENVEGNAGPSQNRDDDQVLSECDCHKVAQPTAFCTGNVEDNAGPSQNRNDDQVLSECDFHEIAQPTACRTENVNDIAGPSQNVVRQQDIKGGDTVNVVSVGYPYLAGVVIKVEGNIVHVTFPKSRSPGPFEYSINQVRHYTTQFPNSRFNPIKLVMSRPKSSQKIMIKTYENRLENYLQNIYA